MIKTQESWRKCCACGKYDDLSTHHCSNQSEGARVGAQRLACDKELRYYRYETPDPPIAQRLFVGLAMMEKDG